jgi:hypothetical protein
LPQQQQQQQVLVAADGGDSAGAGSIITAEAQQEEQPQPKLRMLVYIHYEQLLQVLPWKLPQQLTLPQLPELEQGIGRVSAIARHFARSSGAALWVHIDVCQLHGGAKLGSCVAPLAISRSCSQNVCFEALQQSVLVAVYEPGSSKNSSRADEHASQRQQQQLTQAGQEEDCKLLLLGEQCIGGSSSSSSSNAASSSTGLAQQSSAEMLQELVGRDEVRRLRCKLGSSLPVSD